MLYYILRRLLMLPLVLLGISVVVFSLMSLIPGDPALAILGPYATPERLAALREQMGLDEPMLIRFFTWLGDILQGSFGRSVALQRPVLDEILERVGPTLLLTGAALALSMLMGLSAGAVAAVHRNRWPDRLLTFVVLIGISTPSFWLALLLILVFAVWLNWFPVSGMFSVYGGGDLGDALRHLVLPAFSLALVATGVIARLTRTAMLDVLGQTHIQMARAHGLHERQVIYRHAFKNMLVQVIPVVGLQAGFLLGGAVYIETVFQWPGLGRMLVDAISSRDLLLVQGGVLLMASGYVLVNLLTDMTQHVLDPRLRME